MQSQINQSALKSEANGEVLFPKSCPSRQVIEILADKWKLLIIHMLSDGTHRNGELMKGIEGISQKMLTQTLRAMERDGIVRRMDYKEVPPRVDYSLTDLGSSLRDCVMALSDWALKHYGQIMNARKEHDSVTP